MSANFMKQEMTDEHRRFLRTMVDPSGWHKTAAGTIHWDMSVIRALGRAFDGQYAFKTVVRELHMYRKDCALDGTASLWRPRTEPMPSFEDWSRGKYILNPIVIPEPKVEPMPENKSQIKTAKAWSESELKALTDFAKEQKARGLYLADGLEEFRKQHMPYRTRKALFSKADRMELNAESRTKRWASAEKAALITLAGMAGYDCKTFVALAVGHPALKSRTKAALVFEFYRSTREQRQIVSDKAKCALREEQNKATAQDVPEAVDLLFSDIPTASDVEKKVNTPDKQRWLSDFHKWLVFELKGLMSNSTGKSVRSVTYKVEGMESSYYEHGLHWATEMLKPKGYNVTLIATTGVAVGLRIGW